MVEQEGRRLPPRILFFALLHSFRARDVFASLEYVDDDRCSRTHRICITDFISVYSLAMLADVNGS